MLVDGAVRPIGPVLRPTSIRSVFGDGYPERLNLSSPNSPSVFGPDKLSASLLTLANTHQFAEASHFPDPSDLFQIQNEDRMRLENPSGHDASLVQTDAIPDDAALCAVLATKANGLDAVRFTAGAGLNGVDPFCQSGATAGATLDSASAESSVSDAGLLATHPRGQYSAARSGRDTDLPGDAARQTDGGVGWISDAAVIGDGARSLPGTAVQPVDFARIQRGAARPGSDAGPLANGGCENLASQLRFGALAPILKEKDSRLEHAVINLSTFRFSEAELEVLSGCLKFRPTPVLLPSVELIAASESIARNWDFEEPAKGSHFRNACAQAIKSASLPEHNLDRDARKILKRVSQNENLVVTQADKGGKIVLLDLNQYSEMCLLHLQDDAYERVVSFGKGKGKVLLFDNVAKTSPEFVTDSFLGMDPYDKLLKYQCYNLTKILNELVKNKQLDKEQRRKIIPNQPYSGTVPKFYGLPKVHKIGTLQLRPIVSSSGLYCDSLMLLLKSILNLLLWGTTSIANSYDLVNLLENFEFSESDVLVSFDVTSLFTRVPVPEMLQLVEKRLRELRELDSDPVTELTSLTTEAIMELLHYTMNDCFFTWDKVLYKQKRGVPMGGRLSPILAVLFMESLEYSVLCSAPIVPRLFLRYVDDILIIWDESKGPYKDFLALLNAYHPAIVLTEEKEKDRNLAFLDVSITRPLNSAVKTTDKKLQISIFRKPTHSNRYLHFKSAHPLQLKENVARGLWLRAQWLLKNYPNQLRSELQFLKKSLTHSTNDYPIPTVNKWFAKFQRQLRNNPNMLKVRSRLSPEQIFCDKNQQKFESLSAQIRFPTAEGDHSQNVSAQIVSDAEIGHKMEINQQNNTEEHQINEELLPPENNGNLPTLVIPYIPGISDQLKRIAEEYEINTWFTYPGSAMDQFTVYRGRLPVSKVQHSIYRCMCSCGTTYVGESLRNLKVRVSEHLHASSKSSFSDHLQNYRHRPALKDTVVLSREKNTVKRKLIESICIAHFSKEKEAKQCNSGLSSDIPAIWQICTRRIERQLRKKPSL